MAPPMWRKPATGGSPQTRRPCSPAGTNRPEPVPEPRGGRCPAELRKGGGNLVEACRAGGLDEHNVAGGEMAAQPVDGRVVAG
jgi:hypothetical protein